MKALVAVIFLLFSQLIGATPVTWVFSNTSFDDGGSLEGSFVWDADNLFASNIDLITTLGSSYQGTAYSICQGGQCDSGQLEQKPRFIFTSSGTLPALFVELDGPLTNLGGSVSIVVGVCAQSCENWGIGLTRNVTYGQLTAVPLPPAVWLFGSALAGLGWVRRKES
jgi:hypothetical protein